MVKRLAASLVAVLLLLGLSPGEGAAQAPAAGLIPDQYVVVLQRNANARVEAQAAERAQGVRVFHVYEHALRGFAFRGSAQAAQALARNPAVRFVAQDRRVQAADQTVPTGVRRVAADRNATAKVDGIDERVNVNVAVLDTGIDPAHPDLNVIGGANCMGDGATSADGHGHGTHVAGTIGAIDNTTGVVGVAPGARLWAVRVLDNAGNGTWATVICGIDWATATRTDGDTTNDIAVANMSLSGPGADDGNCGNSNNEPVHQAICGSVAAGVLYVVAAGNSNQDAAAEIPAAYDEVLTVSAIADSDGKPGGTGPFTLSGADDTLASFSNFGADVDIAGPGVNILSTAPGGGTATKSGTSMAAPHVAGAAALCVAVNGPAQNADGVATIRQRLADPAFGYAVAQGGAYGFRSDRDSFPESLLYVGAHDVAVTVVAGPASVAQGGSATITVDLANPGAFVESFAVTLVDTTSGGTIGTQSVSNLAVGGTTRLTFTWATSAATSAGDHLLTATAATVPGETATANNSRSATVRVVSAPTTMHVSDLDRSSTRLRGGQWRATVTITVHDDGHGPVSAATVMGVFAHGSTSQTVSCTTGAGGTCTVNSASLANSPSTATFTVSGITHATRSYTASANHDPEGDSDGTKITITR